MPFFNSRVAKFKIDDTGGTLRDLSAYIRELKGLPGARPMLEVTALGDTGARYEPDIERVEFTIKGFFNDAATSGPDAVLGPLRAHTSAVDFEYGPEGDTGGDIKYSGTCWVVEYDVDAITGKLMEYFAKLLVNGTVTRGTF